MMMVLCLYEVYGLASLLTKQEHVAHNRETCAGKMITIGHGRQNSDQPCRVWLQQAVGGAQGAAWSGHADLVVTLLRLRLDPAACLLAHDLEVGHYVSARSGSILTP